MTQIQIKDDKFNQKMEFFVLVCTVHIDYDIGNMSKI